MDHATLPTWIAAVDASQLPGLTGFALHLHRDFDAVSAGLTLDWNSGSIEGAVNRIKKIKRQLYGRAEFVLRRGVGGTVRLSWPRFLTMPSGKKPTSDWSCRATLRRRAGPAVALARLSGATAPARGRVAGVGDERFFLGEQLRRQPPPQWRPPQWRHPQWRHPPSQWW
ncbi:hypothetical protein [Streptomyces sp. NPDC006691]|uniref:hypothetical protein n=1 Tax=Streptomyces sp. NPDC006691 TaxID=3364757 RepID=UPI00367CFD1E